ncbi:sialate O-acetylesterase-like [Biomphalaria glabrata]|uniref:Sialate O-acetylesterase-like n=2 Tax=Biomphalaria glabrata TaxID=6526 RepID=A0A9W3AQI6_BIOGL|nr:sialate O-acetylesterase-like [Biomphalaria glabrata]
MLRVKFLLVLCFSLAIALNLHHMSADNQPTKFERQDKTYKTDKLDADSFVLARQFQNHMVLQRAPQRANIYGFSPTIGQKVTLQLVTVPATKTYSYETTVHQDGTWNFVLDPFAAGVTVNIRVDSGGVSHSISDVIFGDVWICSGQSNMQMTVFQIDGAAEEIADAHNYPNIRLMTVSMNESSTPLRNLIQIDEPWSKANNSSVGSHTPWTYFSAVCWLFGKSIYKARRTPIGLVATDWGGTVIKAWSSPEALAHCGVHETDDQQEFHKELLKDVPDRDRYRLQGPKNNSVLWNSMIHPLLGMTIYGAIWYQGESDSGGAPRNIYNCTFPTMIKDWRGNWNRASNGQTSATFPFGFVQLAPYHPSPGSTSGFSDIRWHQTADRGYVPNPDMPNVFMAVAVDLPDFNSTYGSIHPRYKRDVGARLALSGLAVAYHQSGIFQGPLPTGSHSSASGLIVDYGNTWKLSVVINDGFEVQCAHLRWVADPIVAHTNTTVTLKPNICHTGEKITGLRYAWSESPCALHRCAIYETSHNLPGPPFISYADFDPKGEPYFTFDQQTHIRND